MQVNEEKEITIKEFFDMSQNDGGIYEVETPSGWIELGGLVKKLKKESFRIDLADNISLEASDDHLIMTDNGWKNINDLALGSMIKTINGYKELIDKEYIGVNDTFDFEVKSKDHAYYSNGVESHNTGKTTLGKIICNKAGDKTVIWVTPDLIAENTQSKHAIKLLYMLADFVSPSALLLEDIDLWANDRDDMGDTLRLGALMNILDGVNSINNCVTIAMTNRIELIEKALRNRPGRFDVIVEIPALIKSLRERMLKDRLANIKVDDDVIPYVLVESEGWTGAYVQHFVHTANMYFVYHRTDKHLTLDVAKSVLETIKKFTYRERGEDSLGFK